jgi:hypothetical protein
MSKYLIKTTEVYRADTEGEATALIEEAKKDGRFVLAKYSTEKKEVKSKGEVVEAYELVTLTKSFNDPKMPESVVDVEYNWEN